MKLTKFALLTVATLLISQILLVEGNKQKEGRKGKQKGAEKEEKQKAPSRNGEKERGAKGGKGSLQGKFHSKDKADCIWSVSGTETVALNVECTKGETKVSCTYGGNPTACPKYAANQKNYWKQITRALKKQKNICQDQKAVLKSKECKKGPAEAHLTYILPTVPVPNRGHNVQEQPNPTKVDVAEENKDCVEDEDILERRRLAKEYCGEWSSFCSFFFSMVQDKTC
ncbi:fibroblast growth factor-binding protein 1 [Leptodactylus fuscus]|uniref:fibroblast growth factor-binding protein 1 n=1 Tax=Leptodactylus fuscus TaxID=238119 RepID=UPI003F4F12EE